MAEMPTGTDHCGHKPFIGIATLMRRLMSGAALADLVNLAANDPDGASSLMGLSAIFQFTGNRDASLELQTKALQLRQHYHLAPWPDQPDTRLLAIMRPGGMMDNTPLEFLLEGSLVALDYLFVATDLPVPTALPDHDLLFVAIAPSEQNQPLLKLVGKLIKSSKRPLLNAPEQIACLSRDGVSARLQGTPGAVIPITARVDRRALQDISAGEKSITSVLADGDFPIILRPAGSQAGEGLVRIDEPEALAAYLGSRLEHEFQAARFVDYRGADGWYRKCRLVLIAGQSYVCHLAISDHWMIHYNTAEMSESAAKRTEEASFMASFDEDFAYRHREALHAIGERLGLDYLVIDCGETPDGRLLIFEADNIGFVHAMDPADIFPYKLPQMHKVFSAFQAMLRARTQP